VPDEAERALALSRVGMQHVEMDEHRRTVRYHRPGLEINLGSIGKGYALDRMGHLLAKRWKISAMLLHGGSSSVYAKGDPHRDGRGWRVRIRHPWMRDRVLAQVWLRDQALGTSAATFQYLEHEGKKLGHILDPRTCWPASGLASVSVVAPTAAEADALSTAFYVGGIDVARRWCESHPHTGAILLPEGSARPVVIGKVSVPSVPSVP
jgi:thiamine biosynthesis lipoprotein